MVYTTRANVETFLRTTFDGTTTPTDAEVDAWVTDVDAEVDRLTGTAWQSTSATDTIDVRAATNKFLVSKYPLISVTSVEYNDYTNADPEFNPNWVSFDNSRVVGDVIITDKQVSGNNKVRIVYEYGHTTIPPEVEHLATLLITKKIVSSDNTSNGAYTSVSVGGLSITNNVSVNRVVSLDNDINETLKRIGKYTTVFM